MKILAHGVVAGTFMAALLPPRQSEFVTSAAASLVLDASGIVGDLHAGAFRKAGPREAWLPRGATLRNDRQLSALCSRNGSAAICSSTT